MKSILDPDFKYVPSVETNLKKTFARIRREQAEEKRRVVAETKVVFLRDPPKGKEHGNDR